MFSSSSSSSSNARFDKIEEFQKLRLVLKKLREQENSLPTEISPDETKGSDKKTALRSILEVIDALIEKFNASSTPSRVSIFISFILAMQQDVRLNLEINRYVLSEPRSGIKPFMRRAICTTTFVGGVGAGVSTGSILVGLLGSLTIAPKISYKIINTTGLDDERTTSVKIIEEMIGELSKILPLLYYQLELDIINQHNTSPLICPITKVNIKHPVLCTLDCIVYEKQAIKDWLDKKSFAPSWYTSTWEPIFSYTRYREPVEDFLVELPMLCETMKEENLEEGCKNEKKEESIASPPIKK